MFERDGERMAQADQLEQLDVASVFIRLESGHSNRSTVQHAKFDPNDFRYLVHGTNERRRQDVHFAFDCSLTTMQDSLRPESDCS